MSSPPVDAGREDDWEGGDLILLQARVAAADEGGNVQVGIHLANSGGAGFLLRLVAGWKSWFGFHLLQDRILLFIHLFFHVLGKPGRAVFIFIHFHRRQTGKIAWRKGAGH